jgi:hypothetical protein
MNEPQSEMNQKTKKTMRLPVLKYFIPVFRQVFVANMLIASLPAAAPVGAQADYGPDTCVLGFVWREAFNNDHVCVTPETRAQAARDNTLAASRRNPNGGPYGPDTCLEGFVWRDANPGRVDHVCVTPDVRTQASTDNNLASSRKSYTPDKPYPRAGSGSCNTSPKGTPTIFVLPDGNLESRYPNGVKQREFGSPLKPSGAITICPDGSSKSGIYQYLRQDVISPTPPSLPNNIQSKVDPWLMAHNESLLEVIKSLAQNNEEAVNSYLRNVEGNRTVYSQVETRTKFISRMIKKLKR